MVIDIGRSFAFIILFSAISIVLCLPIKFILDLIFKKKINSYGISYFITAFFCPFLFLSNYYKQYYEWMILLICYVIILTVSSVILYILLSSKDLKIEKIKNEFEEKTSEKEEYLKYEMKRYNSLLSSYYGDDYLYKACLAPEGDFVGVDLLPASRSEGDLKWGEKYTFFIAPGESNEVKKYHLKDCFYCESMYRCVQINALEIVQHHMAFSPCQHCNPVIPDVKWAKKYREIKIFINKMLLYDKK